MKLRGLSLPALTRLARASGDAATSQTVEAPAIEELIRRAISDLGAGRLQETLLTLYGFAPGSRLEPPSELRRSAASAWGVSQERFRRDPQATVISELAEALLRRAARHAHHLAHFDLERRAPTSSRLAVAWLERFEAYYRIWTPVSGIASDLCAYRSTLLEPDRPYDRPPGTKGPDDPGYTQEDQAAGYVTFALWHFTRFLCALSQFNARYGGMWLLSDATAEQELQDALYRIGWHSPNNERDDSYLRRLHDQANGELHEFLNLLRADPIGRATEAEWRAWAASCQCIWTVEDEVDREHFPTHRHHTGIRGGCSLHSIVLACGEYTALVDDDWRRVADWYRLDASASAMINDRRLYHDSAHHHQKSQTADQSK